MHLQHTRNFKTFTSRGKALEAAHDMAREMSVLEYGVFEAIVNPEPCGECYVCRDGRVEQ